MNSGSQALTLRTKLLVAEYGRKRVIAALARVEEVEFETMEREIDAAKVKRSSTPRRPKTVSQLLNDAKIDPQTFSLI